jgi:N-dimethylarginine dimethylaminohydrolase
MDDRTVPVGGTALRPARARRYLMCRPTHFDVVYAINPWMEPTKPTDPGLAAEQWERLRSLFHGLGHEVELVDPLAGQPDMVFAANGATVVDGRVLAARFRHPERAAEGPAFGAWFSERGYDVRPAEHVNEGEGDLLVVGDLILAGSGFRTTRRAHAEAEEFFGRTVVGLTLVDPRFYHLDTALGVLDDDEIMYYPPAFAPESRRRLEELFPTAVRAGRADAEVLGLNAVSDGRHVVLPSAATGLKEQLWARGYLPIGVDLSELLKAGGGVKCCTLELRDERPAARRRRAQR